MDRAAKIEVVTRALRARWDPIGSGVPDDEYASYAPKVVLLADRAMRDERDRFRAVAEITSYLAFVRIVKMGLDDENERRDADGAIACVDALYPV